MYLMPMNHTHKNGKFYVVCFSMIKKNAISDVVSALKEIRPHVVRERDWGGVLESA